MRSTLPTLPWSQRVALRSLGILTAAVTLWVSPAQAQDAGDSGPDRMERFEAERLLLLDHRGRAIGPAESGFSSKDLGRFNELRFHAVRAGELRYRLTFEEFVDLTQSRTLEARLDRLMLQIKRRRGAGDALIVVGATLATAGLLTGSIAYATGIDPDIHFPLAIFFSGSAGFLVGGISTRINADRRLKLVKSHDLESLSNRDEAWRAAQDYNDALWDALELDEPPAAD